MSEQPRDLTLSTFTASDGDNIVVQDWPRAPGQRLRGFVLLVHGLGEHAGRYDQLACQLNAWGFDVRSYDQYGHGESGGVRGGLPSHSRLVDDLADLVESARYRLGSATPLILLGHSLGGLVAASFVARGVLPIDGLVLSSPAFGMRLSAVQKLLLKLAPRLAPNLAVSNGIDPRYLSHDPAVVAAYRQDPRVHDRISGRMGNFIAQESQYVLQRASKWRVPTLLMYAGDDHLVDPAGSRAFAAAAPPPLVDSYCFEDLYHEVFNEAASEGVYARLGQWLEANF